MKDQRRLSGVAASAGKASGRAVLSIRGMVERKSKLDDPFVVVADVITRELVPLLTEAAGIVSDEELPTEVAGITRELGVPCIVSTKYASRRIHQGDWVEIDGDADLVRWNPFRRRCVFCGIHSALRVIETKYFFAIYDAYPLREGHLLVIPVRHVERIRELTESEFYDMHSVITHVDELLRWKHRAAGYNIGVNDGLAAGQTIKHLHVHVIPRLLGDVPDPRGGVRNFLPNPLTEYP